MYTLALFSSLQTQDTSQVWSCAGICCSGKHIARQALLETPQQQIHCYTNHSSHPQCHHKPRAVN